MGASFHTALESLRTTRVWKSVLRRGPAVTSRTRSLAVSGNLLLHWIPVKVREKSLRVRATYYLGSLSLMLFIILVVTGVLLMFYYHPTAPKAYYDMKDLRFVVSNGVLVRNLHRVAAHLMVLVVFCHMFHVFYRGGYRPPHEFNWVIGVILLFLTLSLSYTGYLLPWDQLAFWAITVGTNIISAAPVIGNKVRFMVLGGHVVGENTLLRFYILHVVILPLLACLFIGVHIWRVQKDGGLTVASKDDDEQN
jgi:quinol-cytochrome oxidoreductase complex cytochrome b subunit